MDASNELLIKMEEIIDALVENAQELKTISTQVVSEKEIDVLQKKQEDLVHQLKNLQNELQNDAKAAQLDPQSPVTQRIVSKLQLFQELNAAYIENLSVNREIIKFKKHD